MKKLLYAFFATFAFAFAFVSCSEDLNENLINSEDLTYQEPEENTTIGTYIGVFTTNDSEYRATFEITIPKVVTAAETEAAYATATLRFSNGDVVFAKASKILEANEQIEDLEFKAQNVSFLFSVNDDGTNPIVSNVLYNTLESSVLIAKDSQRAPVTPILGTFACTDCGTHPTMNTSNRRTFNILSVSDNGNGTSTISTQIILGNIEFLGTGLQDNCVADGTLTTCNVAGETSIFGNSTVTWQGTYNYNNEATGPNDCSDFKGTWTWPSTAWGVLTGNFHSETDCLQPFYFEDFTDFDGSGFAPNPSLGQLDSDVIIATGFSDGNVTYGGTQTTGDFARGSTIPNNNTGGIYAFSYSTSSFYGPSLGVQPDDEDFTPGTFEFRVQNNTGGPLTNFRIIYNVACFGTTTSSTWDRISSLDFSYSFNGTDFTPKPELKYTSTIYYISTKESTNYMNRSGPIPIDLSPFIQKSSHFTGNLPDGAYIYLRFTGDDVSGSIGDRFPFLIDNVELRAL